ncbi:holo-ACP synthase [bacterium BMS3Abin03]|jgi:holo-[acyl-carrier protein] synthase|nr:holo-ACP synthase [bacterium BMS3Abin03]
MVIGIGTDIIEIDRIKNSIEEYGDNFLSKIYTPIEIDYCNSKANKYQHFAARFAAKEAIYKALATGWQKDLYWQDIEISNLPTGMPVVNLNGKLKKFLSDDKELKISISHSNNYVTCVAIIYKINP